MNVRNFVLILLFFSAQLFAQATDPTQENENATGSGGWTYIGNDKQIGIGIDDDGDILGDFFFLLSEDNDSSWLGEGWIADGGAGGLKLNYHFVSGDYNPDQPDKVPDNVAVQKFFLAVDQNEEEDRKATVGWGLEKASWFANIQGSFGLTDERLVSQTTDVVMFTETGVMNGRDFMQEFTTTTITDLWEQAYDYGVGLRLGRWF
ncbi:MAG TPA: hypothetical protein VJ984_06215, partial [Xanthomonadales bacterium]|nr:hypothetical protein [Xanthomonadales bacterium]